MLGGETVKYLENRFAESFKREVEADEAIWRSLPFFAAIIALAVAVMPAIYRSIMVAGKTRWLLVSEGLYAIALVCFGIAAVWFWSVIRLRVYRYPPPDREVVAYGEELDAFYAGEGLSAEERDESTNADLRAFLLEQYAVATTNNRRNNSDKAAARSMVLLFVMAGFLLAFLSEATILAQQAFSGNISGEERGADVAVQPSRRRSALDGKQSPTCSAPGAAGPRGRERKAAMVSPPAKADRCLSDDEEQQPVSVPTERPRPPEPELLKKNEEPRRPRQ